MRLVEIFFFVGAILLLGACGSTGGYDSAAWNRQAQEAPRPLSTAAPDQTQTAAVQPGTVYPGYDPALHEQVFGQAPEEAGRYEFPAGQDYGDTGGYDASLSAASPELAYEAPAPAAPVKVALLVPLSGPQADLGQAMLQAAQLALFDTGFQSFELMPRDAGDTPQEAVAAAQSAIGDGAQLILGPVFASAVKAVQPVAASRGINVIAFSTDWNLAGYNTYIMGFMPFGQVQRVVGYAAAGGLRRIGVLAPDNPYGSAVVSAYRDAASRAGVTTVDIVRFPENRTDLSDLVRAFTRYDERIARRATPNDPVPPPPFDAVLLPVGGEKAKTIADLLTYFEAGPSQAARLGTGLWDDPSLAAEKNLDGAWFAAPAPVQRRDFEKRYRETYGLRPPRLATLAYDATALAAVLARNGARNSGGVSYDRRALTNPNGFAGLDGVFRFRPDGLVERGLAVLQFHDGSIAVADPAPQTFQYWAGQ